MQVELRIPSFWQLAAEYLSGSAIKEVLCIETAHLDTKSDASMAALALAHRGDVGLICADIPAVRWAIEAWDVLGLKHRAMGDVHRYVDKQSGSILWLSTSAEKLSDKDLSVLIIVDAHLLPEQSLFAKKNIVVGRIADRGHWFYSLGQRESTILGRIPMHDILEGMPRLLADTLDPKDPYYKRRMLCEDVVPIPLPFLVIAKRRFKIRTDKGPTFLTPLQQREAETQRHGHHAAAAIVTFDASPVQRRYLAAKRLAERKGYRRIILLKYRRGGFTTLEQAESYRVVASQPNSFVATIADVKEKSQRIFRIAKLLHERDPEAPRAVGDSKTMLELSNGSFFFIGTAGSRAFGRGDTLQRAHLSEVAYFGRSREAKVEDVEGFIAGVTEAASNGTIVAESTANGREWFCQTYEEAKTGANEWYSIFLPWFIDPANRLADGEFNEQEIISTVTSEEKNFVIKAAEEWKIHISPAMIAFRRKKKRDLKHLFPQEYPENDTECFLTSGISFFNVPMMLKLLESLPEHKRRHIPGGYEIRWKEPEKDHEYVAGVDTSEGLPGCDFSGVGILDRKTGEQVAAIHGLFRPHILGEHVARIATDYNKAIVGVERENHGHAVLQKLVDLGYGEPHYRGGPLYYFEPERTISSHKERYKQAGRAGWSTNERTRPLMLDDLQEALEAQAIIVHHREFVSETLTFKLQPNGRFDHDRGAHDDTIFMWGIAWQMRKLPRRSSGLAILEGGI